MIEHVVPQLAQARGDGLRIPADYRFRMASLHQLLHLFRLMQADGDMLLQIERYLKGARQALVAMVAVGRQHMHLLITGIDQIDRFLLARQQRRQRLFRVGKLGQQGIFRFAVVGQLAIKEAEAFTQRLFFPQAEPEPVEQAVPEGAADIEQRRRPKGHTSYQSEGKNRGDQRGGQKTRVQRADFTGDSQQQRHDEQRGGQRHLLQREPLNEKAAEREQRTADDQPLKEAFMRRIQTGDVAAGGHQRKQQSFLQIPQQPADGHR